MEARKFRNLNLFTIRYPFTAIISILHRLSGLWVFLVLPFLLWGLATALHSAAGLTKVHDVLFTPIVKGIVWLSLVALWYHLLAGVRHMIMDIGYAESLFWARVTGAASLVITLIIAVFLGIWLW